MVIATNTPIVDHLQPKVVAFELSGSDVALFELNTAAVYEALPSNKLLQTFVVTAQNAQSVTFKWDYGLHVISLKPPYGASDAPATLNEMVAERETVLPPVATFVRRAVFADNHLEIEQLSRVRQAGLKLSLMALLSGQALPVEEQELTVQVNTTIAPYVPNPHFAPRFSTKQKGVGYFEVSQMRKDDGARDVLAMRWDLSEAAGPVTYAISRDAPPDMVDTIREGVLYWNKVMGRTVLRVETDVDPRERPAPRRVLVHWIPWRLAGFARASLQADPITGEIIAGNVYLTSAFNYMASVRLRDAQRPVSLELAQDMAQDEAQDDSLDMLLPAGFNSGLRCVMGAQDDAADATGMVSVSRQAAFAELAAVRQSERLPSAVKDYLRVVVAHEVGHTLGLRHNFAGSLEAELPTAAAHVQAWTDYRADTSHRGAITSSTVMDYLAPRDDFLLGAVIKRQALPYDRAAMVWGYSDTPVDVATLHAPLFCTDTEMARRPTLGCRAFDAGRNPIDGYIESMSTTHDRVPQILLDKVLLAIRPAHPGDTRTVRDALRDLDPKRAAIDWTAPARQAFLELGDDARALTADRAQGGRDWLNDTDYARVTHEAQGEALAAAQGLPGFFSRIYGKTGIERGALARAMTRRLADGAFVRGTTLAGTAYTLTAAEVAEIQTLLPKFATNLEDAYLRALLLGLTGEDPKSMLTKDNPLAPLVKMLTGGGRKGLSKDIVQDAWQAELAALAEHIVLDTDGVQSGTLDGKPVDVVVFKYPQAVRLAAIGLYDRTIFPRDGWLHDSSMRLTMGLVMQLQALLPAPKAAAAPAAAGAVPFAGASSELQTWAKEQLSVVVALKKAQSGAAAKGLMSQLTEAQ